MFKKREKNYLLTGFLGAIAFHLMVLIGFLSFKLSENKIQEKEEIVIEFAEEDIKELEQLKKLNTEITPLSQDMLQNIASNTAEKMNDKISTEKYINDVMKELGIESMNPNSGNDLENQISTEKYIDAVNNELKSKNPKDKTEQKEETELDNTKSKNKKDDHVYYFGASKVEYRLSDNRNASHVETPVYMCQGGGTVIVKIVIDQSGQVIESKIANTSVNDECLIEAAIKSASAWLFQSNYSSPKRVEGTITYMFVAQ